MQSLSFLSALQNFYSTGNPYSFGGDPDYLPDGIDLLNKSNITTLSLHQYELLVSKINQKNKNKFTDEQMLALLNHGYNLHSLVMYDLNNIAKRSILDEFTKRFYFHNLS